MLPFPHIFFSLVNHNTTRWNIFCDKRSSSYYRTFTNRYSIKNCHITSNPAIILNCNSFLLDSLAFDAALCIREHMIFCKQAAFRAKHHILADSDFSRTAYISIWSNRAVFSHRQTYSVITTIIARRTNHNASAYSYIISEIQSIRAQSMNLREIFKLNILSTANMFSMGNLYVLPYKKHSMRFFKKDSAYPPPLKI